MTNEKLQAFLHLNPEYSLKPYFQPLTLIELESFFGLLIEIGASRLYKEPLDILYSQDINNSRPIFVATMPRDRFKKYCVFYDLMIILHENYAILMMLWLQSVIWSTQSELTYYLHTLLGSG